MSNAIFGNGMNARPEKVLGRLAPSPSGRLHMGNILSFMLASIAADSIVLRIEDLDPDRCKQQFVNQLLRDLDYLGFVWEGSVVRQSTRTEAYLEAYRRLEDSHMVYPCFCTRADLHSANAPHFGDEIVYANTCRHLSDDQRKEALLASTQPGARKPSWRLVVNDEPVLFDDLFQGHQEWCLARSSGDFIVRRSDGVFAYQLAVVVDDAAMGVNQVVRGVDLLSSVPRQRYLQDLIGFGKPEVGHVPLLIDEEGRRLSKRNGDASLSYLIEERGLSGREILGHLAHLCGIVPDFEPLSLDDLKKHADLSKLAGRRHVVWQEPNL